VACWGPNDHGQLGRGVRALSTTPVAVAVGAPVLEVRTGHDHACARTASDVRCWGSNAKGELGDGSSIIYRTSPVTISTGLATVTNIAVGNRASCAFGGGQLACWGEGADTPQLTPFSGTTITSVAIGTKHLCAIVDDVARCAGENESGQLGDNTTTASSTPVAVGLTTTPSVIVAGRAHTCALAGGAVSCWGAGGRVGDGTTQQRNQPTPITLPGNVFRIAAGLDTTLALTTVGEVFCWGDNSEGECGLGDTDPRLSPTPIPGLGTIAEISLSAKTSCVRSVTGGVSCFGAGGSGQLGNGATTTALTPVAVSNLAAPDQISAGGIGGCAVTGGEVRCWGNKGVLGDGDNSMAQPLPVAMPADCP
jgi:alpha-tubulin suppressor-like RCC1 family protein